MSKVLVILSELTDRDIDWLIANGTRTTISKGTILIQEGQPLDALYIVIDGTLSVSVAALADREISQIGCGEVLGEMSLVDERLPSASVTAIEDSTILSIPRYLLMEKLDQDVLFSLRFYRAITKFLSNRLRGTVNRLSDSSSGSESSEDGSNQDENKVMDGSESARAKFDSMLQRLKGS